MKLAILIHKMEKRRLVVKKLIIFTLLSVSYLSASLDDFEMVENLGLVDSLKADAISQGHEFKGDLIDAGKKAAEKVVDNVVKDNELLHKGCVESIILGSNILGPLGYGFDRLVQYYGLWWMPTLVLERLRRGYAECICDNAGKFAAATGTSIATENPAPLIGAATKCIGYMLTAAYNEMTIWAAGIAGWWSWGKNKMWSSKQPVVEVELPVEEVVVEEIQQKGI